MGFFLTQRTLIIVIGSANRYIVASVERLPRAGETLAGSDFVLLPGGKGANQACAAARLGGAVTLLRAGTPAKRGLYG